jgi:hypothetical protein
VYFESSHMHFLVGASVESTISQDHILHDERLTFGVVRSEAQSSAREGPSCSLQSRLRRQFLSVGASDRPGNCPCTCMLDCPFIDFGYSRLPLSFFFLPCSSLLSSPESTFLPAMAWGNFGPGQKWQLTIIILVVEPVILRNEGAKNRR